MAAAAGWVCTGWVCTDSVYNKGVDGGCNLLAGIGGDIEQAPRLAALLLIRRIPILQRRPRTPRGNPAARANTILRRPFIFPGGHMPPVLIGRVCWPGFNDFEVPRDECVAVQAGGLAGGVCFIPFAENEDEGGRWGEKTWVLELHTRLLNTVL